MLKPVLIVVVVALIALLTFSLSYGRSLRHGGILQGTHLLKQAQKDYMEKGYLTNHPTSGYRVSLFTNIVTVGGTQYQCFAAMEGGKFRDEGSLVMSTNQVFIWLDAKHPPKVIGEGYRPQLFPGRF